MFSIRVTAYVHQQIARSCVLGLLAATLAACGGARNADASDSVAPAAAGSELFERLQCIHCHQMNGKGVGPSLAGIAGATIQLENGEIITVDEAFIRTAILDPQAQTHAGYQPIMPSFAGRIDEDELAALVEYILALEE